MRRLAVAAASVIVVPAALVALGGCDHPSSAVGDRQKVVVEVAIRQAVEWYPTAVVDGELPVVYVVRMGEQKLAATVQAEVIEAMHDTVDVRFADLRDEAIQADQPDLPVKDAGVMLLVGDIPDEGSRVDLPIEVYVDATDRRAAVLAVARSGAEWAITSSSLVEPAPL